MYLYAVRLEITLLQLLFVSVAKRALVWELRHLDSDSDFATAWLYNLGQVTSLYLFLCSEVDICLVQLMGLLGESNKNVYVKLLEKAKVYFHRLLGQTDQYLTTASAIY